MEDRLKAKELIEKIQKDKMGNLEIRLDLKGALEVAEKAIARERQFLLEYLQNAEDAGARRFKISWSGNSIKILNDGKSFDEDDVRAICSIGRQRKDPRRYLGYFGVGFKSSFLISERACTFSWPYSFEFNKRFWDEKGEKDVPWQITPLWIENYPEEYKEFNTVFELLLKEGVLYLKEEKGEIKRVEIKKVIEEEVSSFSPICLLFLRNVKEMEIERIGKIRKFQARWDGDICELKEEGEEESLSTKWLVLRKEIEVPSWLREDELTKRWGREKAEIREIAVAFKLTDEGDLESEFRGGVRFSLFSFLPLRAQELSLRFLLSSDFLTDPGRNYMLPDAPWNFYMLRQALSLIKEKAIPYFQKNERWRFTYTNVLWNEENLSPFKEEIGDPLKEEVKEGEHFITLDETFTSFKNILKAEQDLIKALGKELIEKITEKYLLHPDCKTPREIRIPALPLPNLFRDLKTKWETFNVEERTFALKKLLAFWSQKVSKADEKEKLRLKENVFILDKQGKVGDPFDPSIERKIFLPGGEEEAAERIIPGTTRFLHPSLREQEIIKALQELGAREIKWGDILKILDSEIPRLLNKLRDHSVDDREKIAILGRIKEAVENGFPIRGKNLLVKTKSEKWEDIESVLWSLDYEPGEWLLKLIEAGLLNECEFLDPIFIEGESPEEVKSWKKFFEEAGISRKVEKQIPHILAKKLENPFVEERAKITALKELKRRWERGESLPRFPIKAKSGEWIEPSKLYFGPEFEMESDLKELLQIGIWIKGVEFVETGFLPKGEEQSWYEFFRSQGVKRLGGPGGIEIKGALLKNLSNPLQKEETKISLIEFLKRKWERKEAPLWIREGSIPLLTTKSEWKEAKDILFTTEYTSEDDFKDLLEEDFPFLSSRFIEGKSSPEIQQWANFFEELGVGKKERQALRTLVDKSREILREADRIRAIKGLRKAWERGERLSGIILRSKSGNWIPSYQLLFREEYKPDEEIEELVEEGLIEGPFEFLDPLFIEEVKDKEEKDKWTKFFAELGVGSQKINIPELLTKRLRSVSSEEIKLACLKKLRELWIKEKFEIPQDLEVKTKSAKWIKASELLFGEEWGEYEDIEGLIKKGLLLLEYEFVSPIFIEGEGLLFKSQWKGFLKALGVGKKLEDAQFRRSLVQKIAINVAKKYLQNEEGIAEGKIKELPESEKERGYDLEVEGLDKYIEVKGQSREEELNLRRNQYLFALRNPDKAFIYIVINALHSPVLRIIKAKRLEEKEEFLSLNLSVFQWKGIVDKEWRPF
jgi:hypothetical protein